MKHTVIFIPAAHMETFALCHNAELRGPDATTWVEEGRLYRVKGIFSPVCTEPDIKNVILMDERGEELNPSLEQRGYRESRFTYFNVYKN